MNRREFLEWCISAIIGCVPGSRKSKKRRSRNRCKKAYPYYKKASMALPFKGWIEYGGNQDPAYFAEPLNSTEIWGTPVDGTVIRIMTNAGVELSTQSVSINKYTIADLSDGIAEIKERNALGWGRVRYNYAKAQISSPTAAVIDWFNPDLQFENIFGLLGEFAAAAGLYGVAFDPEPYVDMWLYTAMPEAGSHTYAEYVTKVKEVARNIATRWLNANPNMQVFFFFGYQPYVDTGGPDENNAWGLFKPFLDEFFDTFGEFITESQKGCKCVCSPNNNPSKARIIITGEVTYGCKTDICLTDGIAKITGTTNPAYKGGSIYFDMIADFGAALWLTHPAFNPATPLLNYFTPTVFKDMLHRLMLKSMMWPWIYDPGYAFFNVGSPVPQDYIDKLFELRDEQHLI